MSFSPLTRRLARTSAGALAGTGLVAAAAIGTVVASSHADAATTASTAPAADQKASHVRCHPGVRLGKAPQALKDDLAAARKAVKDSDAKGPARRAERREALQKIRAAAADGKYGAAVEQRAKKQAERAEARLAALPAQLRDDLSALRKMPPGAQRRAAAKKIREGRLDGTYGDVVKQRAEKQQQRKATCRQERAESAKPEKSGSAANG